MDGEMEGERVEDVRGIVSIEGCDAPVQTWSSSSSSCPSVSEEEEDTAALSTGLGCALDISIISGSGVEREGGV